MDAMPDLSKLARLERLLFGYNTLSSWALPPGCFSVLSGSFPKNQLIDCCQRYSLALSLSGNGLTVVPDAITELGGLKELHLSHNLLSVVPSSISKLTGLTILNFSGTVYFVHVSSPETVLPSLKIGNRLTALPDEITALINLSSLEVTQHGSLYKNCYLMVAFHAALSQQPCFSSIVCKWIGASCGIRYFRKRIDCIPSWIG